MLISKEKRVLKALRTNERSVSGREREKIARLPPRRMFDGKFETFGTKAPVNSDLQKPDISSSKNASIHLL